MKKYLKYYLLIILIIGVISKSQSQGYSRKSLTILMGHYNDDSPIPETFFRSIQVPNRFDFNDIGTNKLELNQPFSYATAINSLEDRIYEERIPNKILKSILLNPDKNYMDLDIIQKRGLYSANDASYQMAKKTAIGINQLKDAGFKLLQNIYFLVILPQYYSTNENLSKGNMYTISGSTHLYQLNLDSTYMANGFWDDFYFDKPNPEKFEKISNYRFSLKETIHPFEVKVSDLDGAGKVGAALNWYNKISSALQGSTNIPSEINASLLSRKSIETIHAQLLDKILSYSLNTITGEEDLKIESSVFKNHPLLSKIGKKEGVKVDNLYEVSERVQNPNNNQIHSRHIGYIRTKRVANNEFNSNGETNPSAFYRVSSGAIRRGMQLSEVHESNTTWGLEYNSELESPIGGVFLTTEHRTHWIPGLFYGLDFGINPDLTNDPSLNINTRNFKLGAFAGTGVLSLKQNISINHISISPLGGLFGNYILLNSATYKGLDLISNYQGLAATNFGYLYGAELGFHFGRKFQLTLGYKFTENFSNPTFKDKNGNTVIFNFLEFKKQTYSIGIKF